MFASLQRWSNQGEYVGRTIESVILTGTQDSSRRESRLASSNKDQKEAKPIEIDGAGIIWSVAFLADGKHAVSGGEQGKIQRWRVEDGQEVGTPMDAGSAVLNIAVSQDGKWIVGGTHSGLVTVWNAESFSKVTEWQAHERGVCAVDVSLDGTRIASGSRDRTACVWSLSTGQRLLGPFKHVDLVVAVKFSPNARLVATATWNRDVRVYDSQHGDLLVEFPVRVNSGLNQSLAWASDSTQVFALSRDGTVHCLHVFTRKTLSKWSIHNSRDARCIALASNSTFIAVSSNSSVSHNSSMSLWDTTTHEQIGSVIEHTHGVWSMAISSKYDLVTGGDNTISLRGLYDILPSRYFDNVRVSA
jgi:WD40 repeat protein